MHFMKKVIFSVGMILPAFLISQSTMPSMVNNDDSGVNSLAVFYAIDGNIEKKYNTLVEKKLKTIGFNLTDPHYRVNDQYETKYGSTVLDVLSFLPVVNDNVIIPLLNVDPRIAGFAPFNMLIYKKLDENTTHIGHLQPKVMLDILEIENKEVREKFTATFSSLDALIEKEMGGKKSFKHYKTLPKEKMIRFEYTFEKDEEQDMDDFIEEFQNSFELAFINKGYLIAGFHDFMATSDEAEEILDGYDAFWTYSLCHLKFSYHLFDQKGARPEAGLFAPCTMYIYKKKGTNKFVVGMFRLHNWSDTLEITSTNRMALINQLDLEIPEVLKDFGMVDVAHTTKKNVVEAKHTVVAMEAVKKTNVSSLAKVIKPSYKNPNITLPTVPTPIKVTQVAGSINSSRSIKFSKRIPPNYIAHRFDKMKKVKVSTHIRIGEVNHGRISAYLRGKFMEVKEVEEKLKSAGFDVIVAAPVDKKSTLISIVFTNKALIGIASKTNKGYMATLRVLVDIKEKTLSITNPLYLAKGFLQKDYDEKIVRKILDKILVTFDGLENSKDLLKYQLLASYNFMKGMPYYKDMIEVASGDDLLERTVNNKRVAFTLKLDNGSTLVGIKLSKRTRKFTKRIGRNNAGMLPYPVLIENGKAKILDPKYYISYMYPLLQMSQFMTIATVPDAMVKDAQRAFRKK